MSDCMLPVGGGGEIKFPAIYGLCTGDTPNFSNFIFARNVYTFPPSNGTEKLKWTYNPNGNYNAGLPSWLRSSKRIYFYFPYYGLGAMMYEPFQWKYNKMNITTTISVEGNQIKWSNSCSENYSIFDGDRLVILIDLEQL